MLIKLMGMMIYQLGYKSYPKSQFWAHQNLFLKSAWELDYFQTSGKNQTLFQVTKKVITINWNYRPASLLPICGKVSEHLIFNSLFNYFIENDLLSSHQSGFIPGDLCVQQLTSITCEMCNALDFNPSLEVWGVFLDISKAFDKVWHYGLIYKLKCYIITGNLLRLVKSFLSDRIRIIHHIIYDIYYPSSRIYIRSSISSYLHK